MRLLIKMNPNQVNAKIQQNLTGLKTYEMMDASLPTSQTIKMGKEGEY